MTATTGQHLLDVRGPDGGLPDLRGARCPPYAASTSWCGRGEVVGVAGESGCGKSTLASTVLRLQPRDATVSGEVRVMGEDVLTMGWGSAACAALGRARRSSSRVRCTR